MQQHEQMVWLALAMKKSFSRFPFKLVAMTVCFRAFLVGMLLVFMCSPTRGEDGEEGQDGLEISSTTKLQSAKFNLGLSEDSPEDDLKRQTIGVGEIITITLTAKPALIGDEKKLEWTVEDEKGLFILPEKKKGVKSIDVQANPAATEGGEVKIKVKTGTGLTSKPYTIKVATPKGAVAWKEQSGNNTPPQIQNQMPGVPFLSAWMIVKVTIYPIEVNFSNMTVLEVDEGYVNPLHNRGNRPPHIPKSKPTEILQTNQFYDEVALDFPITRDQLDILKGENPFTWGHICKFKFAKEKLPNGTFSFGSGVVATTMDCSLSENNGNLTLGIIKFTSPQRPIEVSTTSPVPPHLK